MDIKLQSAWLPTDCSMVKNIPFPRGDFRRIQIANWIMAANELQHLSCNNSLSACALPKLWRGHTPLLILWWEPFPAGGAKGRQPRRASGTAILRVHRAELSWLSPTKKKTTSARQGWWSSFFELSCT